MKPNEAKTIFRKVAIALTPFMDVKFKRDVAWAENQGDDQLDNLVAGVKDDKDSKTGWKWLFKLSYGTSSWTPLTECEVRASIIVSKDFQKFEKVISALEALGGRRFNTQNYSPHFPEHSCDFIWE